MFKQGVELWRLPDYWYFGWNEESSAGFGWTGVGNGVALRSIGVGSGDAV